MHICKVAPDFRNCIIRICEDTDDNTKSHDDQTDTKNRVDASDNLINRNKCCDEIIKKNDSHLINIFSVTVLEILGNDKAVLKVAKQYMGEKTTLLQMKADKELGRL